MTVLIVAVAIVAGFFVTRSALRGTQEKYPDWSPHPLRLAINPGTVTIAVFAIFALSLVHNWPASVVIALWVCVLVLLFGGMAASIVVLRWKQYRRYEGEE